MTDNEDIGELRTKEYGILKIKDLLSIELAQQQLVSIHFKLYAFLEKRGKSEEKGQEKKGKSGV